MIAGAGMAEPIDFKYRAFLSYSHADRKWAKWLHSSLEGFRIDKDLIGRETATGKIPARLRPIFRDRDEFTGMCEPRGGDEHRLCPPKQRNKVGLGGPRRA